jgi:hypothetical protein
MGPFRDLSSTPESGSDPRGRARRSRLLEGQKRRDKRQKGRREAERPLGGSDEPGTSSVGPDWAVAVFTIILGGARAMSFD